MEYSFERVGRRVAEVSKRWFTWTGTCVACRGFLLLARFFQIPDRIVAEAVP
jgi:hypothetical protein